MTIVNFPDEDRVRDIIREELERAKSRPCGAAKPDSMPTARCIREKGHGGPHAGPDNPAVVDPTLVNW